MNLGSLIFSFLWTYKTHHPAELKPRKLDFPYCRSPNNSFPLGKFARSGFPLHTPFSSVQMTFSFWLSRIPTVADSFHSGPGPLASSRNETLTLLPSGRGIFFSTFLKWHSCQGHDRPAFSDNFLSASFTTRIIGRPPRLLSCGFWRSEPTDLMFMWQVLYPLSNPQPITCGKTRCFFSFFLFLVILVYLNFFLKWFNYIVDI